MIPNSEIPNCPEFEVKSKIWKIFKTYEIDPYFYEHYEKKKNTS